MTPFGAEKDSFYMQQALALAATAASNNEVPIGAIVVSPEGRIIGAGYNKVEQRATQAAHAELEALVQAGAARGTWRLDNHWIYVTLEPCAMCMGLIKLSRMAGVIFGAESPLFGNHLDKDTPIPLYKRNALVIVPGVGAQEAAQLLKAFFQEKRNKGG
jgi:tRNA(adenine34) deaminase